jgi:hypothetical protein
VSLQLAPVGLERLLQQAQPLLDAGVERYRFINQRKAKLSAARPAARRRW